MSDAEVSNAAVVPGPGAMVGSGAAAEHATGRIWSVVAALLGVIVVLGVGFSPGIAHNAAHDTRHTLAFPCH